jgi:hypothetical protein
MNPSRLFAVACVVALLLVPVAAQEAPRLLFEVSVDGAVVAKPELRVPLGSEGRLSLDKEPYDLQVRFTPTLRGDDIALALTISSRGEEARPMLRIRSSAPSILEWAPKTGGPRYRIAISRLQ